MLMPLRRPAALLFDMDGTLTEPLLDFPKIKADLGIGNRPILEALAEMGPEQRWVADEILFAHEERAARESTLNAGCRELLGFVEEMRWPTAIITRNSLASAKAVFARHGLSFEVLVTREDGRYKPHPAPLELACEKLSVDVRAAWMIGDGQYDVEAGNAAGCATIWISHGREKPFSAEPSATVRDLHQLTQLLRACRNK